MDYVISNPTNGQLDAVASCAPRPVIINEEDQLIWPEVLGNWYDQKFQNTLSGLHPEFADRALIRWNDLHENDQDRMGKDLVIPDFLDLTATFELREDKEPSDFEGLFYRASQSA